MLTIIIQQREILSGKVSKITKNSGNNLRAALDLKVQQSKFKEQLKVLNIFLNREFVTKIAETKCYAIKFQNSSRHLFT
jgi:hypothetical protein